jgi:hypothetical protein
LNELPDAIALVEPPMRLMSTSDPSQAINKIDVFITESRQRALKQGLMLTRSHAGAIPDNLFGPPDGTTTLRAGISEISLIPVGKALSEDFHLFIKHPGGFTALAAQLSERYPLFAFVRNPLAALASWQCVDIPPHYGRASGAERFDRSLSARLDLVEDRIERQVELLSWFLSVYGRLGADRVLRYEDLVADPAGTLARLHSRTGEFRRAISEYPIEERYPAVDFARLAAALRAIVPLARPFYPDFEDVLDRHTPRPRATSACA